MRGAENSAHHALIYQGPGRTRIPRYETGIVGVRQTRAIDALEAETEPSLLVEDLVEIAWEKATEWEMRMINWRVLAEPGSPGEMSMPADRRLLQAFHGLPASSKATWIQIPGAICPRPYASLLAGRAAMTDRLPGCVYPHRDGFLTHTHSEQHWHGTPCHLTFLGTPVYPLIGKESRHDRLNFEFPASLVATCPIPLRQKLWKAW